MGRAFSKKILEWTHAGRKLRHDISPSRGLFLKSSSEKKHAISEPPSPSIAELVPRGLSRSLSFRGAHVNFNLLMISSCPEIVSPSR